MTANLLSIAGIDALMKQLRSAMVEADSQDVQLIVEMLNLEKLDLDQALNTEQLRKIICALQAELWRVLGIPVERAA